MRNFPLLAALCIAACTAATAAAGAAGGSGSAASGAKGGDVGPHVTGAGRGGSPGGLASTARASAAAHAGAMLPAVTHHSVGGRPAVVAAFSINKPLSDADKRRIRDSGYAEYNEQGQTLYCRQQFDAAKHDLQCFALTPARR
jgi:hypothetical protein